MKRDDAVVIVAEQIDWWFITWSTDVLAAWGGIVGAFASTGAVIVALALAGRDGRRRRREEAEQLVATVREVYIELHGTIRTQYGPGLQYRVKNAASQTIRDVALVHVLGIADGLQMVGWRGVDSGWEEPVAKPGRLGPGDRVVFEPVSFVWTTIQRATAGSLPLFPTESEADAIDESLGGIPTIEFYDAAGHRWRRRANEQPTRVLPPGWFQRVSTYFRRQWRTRQLRRRFRKEIDQARRSGQ